MGVVGGSHRCCGVTLDLLIEHWFHRVTRNLQYVFHPHPGGDRELPLCPVRLGERHALTDPCQYRR